MFKYTFTQENFTWRNLNAFNAQKWDFLNTLNEKPNKLRWLQTIKNTSGRSTKICTSLMINRYSLWINVNCWRKGWGWWKKSAKYNNWKGLGFLAHRQGLWPEQCRTSMISTSMYTYTNINLKNETYQIIIPCDQVTSKSQNFICILSV